MDDKIKNIILEIFDNVCIKTENKDDYIKVFELFRKIKNNDRFIFLDIKEQNKFKYNMFRKLLRENEKTKNYYFDKKYMNIKHKELSSILINYKF